MRQMELQARRVVPGAATVQKNRMSTATTTVPF